MTCTKAYRSVRRPQDGFGARPRSLVAAAAAENAHVRNTFQFGPDDLVSMLPNRGPAMVSLHKDA
ncbi:hypothetical protein A5626_10865 [Mycobacterium marseillense]|nr:hypothetical protein A5626_10865 [Mycobacterium marseillense]